MIHPSLQERHDHLRGEFDKALPFPHIVIDDFFNADAAEQLLAEFPAFDPVNAMNEFGKVGRKAAIADIRKISPFYASVYNHLASREFLSLISELTGVPDLIHDERMFGGGTHENLEGQELDPHVDFNYLEDRNLHRRLNLLLYLNKEWEIEWGGCLEIHSNPRQPAENQVTVIKPSFNRCVIFETSERSWHGFEQIRLPAGKKHLSRKLLSVYLYTRERPAEQIAPSHATFYVQRPLPAHVKEGHTLSKDDVQEIKSLLTRRDGWIEHYQKKELQVSRQWTDVRQHVNYLQELIRVPLMGLVKQAAPAKGFWPDGWISGEFEVPLTVHERVTTLGIHALVPEYFQTGVELSVGVNGKVERHMAKAGRLDLEIAIEGKPGDRLTLTIHASNYYSPAEAGVNTDARKLLLLLEDIRFLSPPVASAPQLAEPRTPQDQRFRGFWGSWGFWSRLLRPSTRE